MKTSTVFVLPLVGLLFLSAAPLLGQVRESVTVDDAGQVLDEIMKIPARGIPASLLSDAQGIVIIPDLLKGSFILGVRHGSGVVLVRDQRGAWRPPAFVSLTGGSVGWQIGVQVTDIILVFKTRNSVQGLLRGKFTLGADAAAAAGPVGREAAAATDTSLKAEIYSYSRSRGLFAGVSLDGSVVQIDHAANAVYYNGANVTDPSQTIPLPPSAVALLDRMSRYTAVPAVGVPTPAIAPVAVPAVPAAAPVRNNIEETRRQLAESSLRLSRVLDNAWKAYLTLPPEIYTGQGLPNPTALNQTLNRFNTVAQDPRYQTLTQRAEFQTTRDLLTKYSAAASGTAPTLAIPSPPR